MRVSLSSLADLLSGTLAIGIIKLFKLLPFGLRRRLFGGLFATLVAPLLGYRQRIRDNLQLACPEIGAGEQEKLIKSTSRNIGKTIIELFSPKDIVALAKKTEIEGPGLSVLAKAAKEGRSVICVSGHFGNYDVARAALIAQGFDLGALYRRLNNKVFHRYYFDNITTTGTPMFERGRPGLGDMVRHIKNGRPLAMLIDQHMDDGAALQFFGQTAYTALSAAQMALKYDTELVPFYAIRQSTGAPFRIILEAPITRGSAETMTQALNDSLEARVRADMGQWLWSHKRWKEPRKTQ